MHEQDLAILKSLVAVIWNDGKFADEERDYLEGLLSGFGASESEANDVREYAKTPRTIHDIALPDLSMDDRKVLLNHAVVLSLIDAEQTDGEKAFITQLAEYLHVPESESQAIIQAAEARTKRLVGLAS
jgi:uncharacterized tellurite resistance protein B-like protein